MPILKKGHFYVNVAKKDARGIASIRPMEDRQVSMALYKEYEDVTQKDIDERKRNAASKKD